ncbi:hypothetical protein [Pseudomonas sp. B7]|uniref:hypothetical protein n=1 Tax=Pseudomonas sp. B7 TaxID=360962 RepID=UPI00191E7526|nr:hypothetical protein [Pseudomonas sp. B7]MBL0793673.1 hypothetical protein [Pseudomonas sp. B7]
MSSSQIDRFNEVSAKLLKDFYRNFPTPHYATPESIGLTDEKPEFVHGEEKVSDEYKALAKEVRAVLLWLIDEGFIVDRNYQFGPSHVLTSDGLKALQQIDPECKAPLIAR